VTTLDIDQTLLLVSVAAPPSALIPHLKLCYLIKIMMEVIQATPGMTRYTVIRLVSTTAFYHTTNMSDHTAK
jgi:hypothetical protein